MMLAPRYADDQFYLGMHVQCCLGPSLRMTARRRCMAHRFPNNVCDEALSLR